MFGPVMQSAFFWFSPEIVKKSVSLVWAIREAECGKWEIRTTAQPQRVRHHPLAAYKRRVQNRVPALRDLEQRCVG